MSEMSCLRCSSLVVALRIVVFCFPNQCELDQRKHSSFTGRKQSYWKVMFLHLSVSHSVHGKGPGAWPGGVDGCVCVDRRAVCVYRDFWTVDFST